MSAYNSRCSMFYHLPPYRFPLPSQVSLCRVMQFGNFPNVCPIHSHSLFFTSSSHRR
uniref:Uncharacterized protein n=1 Tax=Schistosoma mansoni TaxID=6183 RepID=A0A5K4FBI3_SCHMA